MEEQGNVDAALAACRLPPGPALLLAIQQCGLLLAGVPHAHPPVVTPKQPHLPQALGDAAGGADHAQALPCCRCCRCAGTCAAGAGGAAAGCWLARLWGAALAGRLAGCLAGRGLLPVILAAATVAGPALIALGQGPRILPPGQPAPHSRLRRRLALLWRLLRAARCLLLAMARLALLLSLGLRRCHNPAVRKQRWRRAQSKIQPKVVARSMAGRALAAGWVPGRRPHLTGAFGAGHWPISSRARTFAPAAARRGRPTGAPPAPASWSAWPAGAASRRYPP